jgi:mono/diheme cytochrome c family protein
MKTVGAVILTAFAILLSAQYSLAQGGDAKAGKAVFTKSCATCHGPDGNSPKDAIAKMLKAEIPKLGSADVQAKKDDEIKKVITQGYEKMKPVKELTDKDVLNIIAFVRTIPKP